MVKDEQKHVTAASVKMCAVVTLNNDGTLHGQLESKFFDEPFVFTNLMSMIEMMETTFDTKGYPEKHLLPRSFGKSKRRIKKHELDLSALAKERTSFKEKAALASQEGTDSKTCAFEILVNFRHNAEWQGNIRWLEEDVTKQFSSVVELVKLIDNALSE